MALIASVTHAVETEIDGSKETQRRYTFSWLFSEKDTMKPRGGTTSGPKITLNLSTSDAFQKLQEPELSDGERDRLAILAMAGDYRTSFDFIETVGFEEGYRPRQPYQSWGTEKVYLVSNERDFISLQHIIVMHFVSEDGSISDPMVIKHWRQDWRYQDRDLHSFLGRGQFERRKIDRSARKGAWSQTVYQVDDSPRYAATGRWFHAPGVSFWESDDRRRPLPRREFSVREDYHALYGSHRITITPNGWTQEEDALKLVLDDQNMPVKSQAYLAREAGLSRYERISNYDFSAGDEYWNTTADFWGVVRSYWHSLYKTSRGFAFKKSVDGLPMFMALFQMAEEEFVSKEVMAASVSETISKYIIE